MARLFSQVHDITNTGHKVSEVVLEEEEQTRHGAHSEFCRLPLEDSWCGGMGRVRGLACPLADGSGDLSWTLLLCRGT